MSYIDKVLTISTGHLRQSTAIMLDSPNPPVEVYSYPDAPGFLVYVPQSKENEDITRANFSDQNSIGPEEDIPVELLFLWDMARRSGCRWIMFDADADIIDSLPEFHW